MSATNYVFFLMEKKMQNDLKRKIGILIREKIINIFIWAC